MRRLRGRARRWRGWYGASPLHLLALVASFALAGYAGWRMVLAGQWVGALVWFLVAIVAHDLLLFPLYALADACVRRLRPRRGHVGSSGPRRASTGGWINYLRVPALLSLLLLVVWFPLIFELSETSYRRASGLGTDPYRWRWLAVTGVLFACSAVAFALRRAWLTRRPAQTSAFRKPRGASRNRSAP